MGNMTGHTRWVILSVSVLLCTTIVALSACASSSAPTPEPEIEGGLLILSHSTYVDTYGYFHLVGEVQNIGERNTEQNIVHASFFDEDGVVYATGSVSCYRQIIAPTEKSPFEIIFLSAPQGENYMLTTDCQASDAQSRDEVTFRDVNSGIDSDRRYVVAGAVVNEGSDAIEDAMIICTCYDTSGEIVAVGLSFADVSPIPAGSGSTFMLALDPSVGARIDEVCLQSEVQ